MIATSSYPPSPCRRCGRGDANWIVALLGCAHCFDPFATSTKVAFLTKIAECADDVASGRRPMTELQEIVSRWKASGLP